MSEQHKEIWFRRIRFFGIWGIWPVHWKGWALYFTVLPIWLVWTLICAATGLICHPIIVLAPIAADIVWLFVYLIRNSSND